VRSTLTSRRYGALLDYGSCAEAAAGPLEVRGHHAGTGDTRLDGSHRFSTLLDTKDAGSSAFSALEVWRMGRRIISSALSTPGDFVKSWKAENSA